MGDFLEYWFKGFEKGIDELSELEKSKVYAQCGKACSDSYSREIYTGVWNKTKTISTFFHQLSSEIQEISVKEITREREYEVIYHKCLCDLYTKGYMSNGSLCECSRQSLLYNLNSLWIDKDVKVELLDSILRGGSECMLRITIDNR